MASSRLPAAAKPAGSSRPTSMFEVPTEHLKRLQQIGDGGRGTLNDKASAPDNRTMSKQAKRRSLLPTFSRKASTEESDPFPTIREDRSDSEVSSRADSSDDRRAMPPPPLKPSRTSSLRSAGTKVMGKTATAHTRTISRDSNASTSRQTEPTMSLPTSDSGIRRAGSIRLPPTPGQQTIPTRGSSAKALTSSSSVSKRLPPASRKQVPTETSASIEEPANTPTASPPRLQALRQSGTNGAQTVVKKQLQPPSKPAFSTHQQHYSPAKSALPKPPVPTSKPIKVASASSVEAEVPITLEVALEQIELLQLALLHDSAGKTMQQFTESAKTRLGERHARLAADFESIRVHEQEVRRVRNILAVEAWCPDPVLLAEHLQTLSRVVSDLRGHTETGSRYSDLTETFDQWLKKAESDLLDNHWNVTDGDLLPEAWRSTHTSLSLKLRSIQRDISTMPPVPPAFDDDYVSSLEIILDCCCGIAESMLKELELMTKLHKEIFQQGRIRVDEQVSAAIMASSQKPAKEGWRPAWQSVP